MKLQLLTIAIVAALPTASAAAEAPDASIDAVSLNCIVLMGNYGALGAPLGAALRTQCAIAGFVEDPTLTTCKSTRCGPLGPINAFLEDETLVFCAATTCGPAPVEATLDDAMPIWCASTRCGPLGPVNAFVEDNEVAIRSPDVCFASTAEYNPVTQPIKNAADAVCATSQVLA